MSRHERQGMGHRLAVLCISLCSLTLTAIPAVAADAAKAPVASVPAVPRPARLADGTPNLTGFWTRVGGLLDRNFGPGAVAPPPTNATGSQSARSPNAPLRSPYREAYEKVLAASASGIVLRDPTALCLPPGMPRMMLATYGMEILQTPGQVTITSEWQAASRRIWIDGRAQPDREELLPTYAGYSVGRWQGNVLLAETIGVRDDVLIDQSGLPLSDQLQIRERIYLDPTGILIDEVTIDDPRVYEKPWTMVHRYRYRPELNLQEFVCLENNRNVGPNGEPAF